MGINASVLVDSLGWALLHSIWQITLIAALVYAVLRITPRHAPQFRFVAAFSGLAASLLLFIVTWVVSYRTITPTEAVAIGYAVPIDGWQGIIATLGKTTWMVSMLWALGFSWLGIRYLQALRATMRLKLEGTSPVPSDWEIRFRLWVERLGGDARATILQSSRITTPLTIGTFKPVVLVPTGFFLRMPIEQAEAVLVHEIAHICRQDYLLGLIQSMICNIFFFHPAITYLSRQIDNEREFACDARVVQETGSGNALAQGLGKVALESRDMLHGFAMAADGGQTPLVDRITRLRERPFRRENGTITPGAALTLVLAGCLTVAISADASFASDRNDGDQDKDTGSQALSATDIVFDFANSGSAAIADQVNHKPMVQDTAQQRDDWASQDEHSVTHAVANADSWSFDVQPSWSFAFGSTADSTSKLAERVLRTANLQSNTRMLRNAAFEVRNTNAMTAEENADCEEKNLDHAEREADRLEAMRDREEARIEREIERELTQIERQMERESARIEREMERVEREMERVSERHAHGSQAQMDSLAREMAALSMDLEAQTQAIRQRAREVSRNARRQAAQAARQFERATPRAVPAPPRPPAPVVTISFAIERAPASLGLTPNSTVFSVSRASASSRSASSASTLG